MTELVNRAVLPAIPSIRALATPWDCQSPTVASLESPACQDAGKALARDPTHLRGHLSHLTHACRKTHPLWKHSLFPSNSSLSPKLRKSEALLFTFTAFFFLGFGFGNSKAKRGFPFSAFGQHILSLSQ